LTTITDLIIVVVTSLSAFFDLKERRIPNWLILFALMAGLGLNAFYGLQDFYLSFLGFIIGIAIFIIPFALGWLGAGDVKYFGVIGALLGPAWLPRILWYSVVAAGLMAVIVVITHRFNFSAIKTLWCDLKIAVTTLGRVLPDPVGARVAKGSKSVPWGVAFSFGTLFAYFFDPVGKLAGF